MSINWVMLEPNSTSTNTPFTPLPHEQTLYTSPPRTSLNLASFNKFPGKEPTHLTSSSGTLYLTNRRIIYLPTTPNPKLQSFAAPILNTHDAHVAAPWIGPNVWTALVQPVQGGGLPSHEPAFEIKVSFKDGGAYDFHTGYEHVKERLQQRVEVARQSGSLSGDGSESGRGRGGGALAAVDLGNVHLDQLPAYEEAGAGARVEVPVVRDVQRESTDRGEGEVRQQQQQQQVFTPPVEPPPGYEEVQRETVEDELERRLSSGRGL